MPASHLGLWRRPLSLRVYKVIRATDNKSSWSVQFSLDASDLLVATVLTFPGC